MPYASRSTNRHVAAGLFVVLATLALCCAGPAARAADTAFLSTPDTEVRIKAFPPSIQIGAADAEESDSESSTTDAGRAGPRTRFDADEHFDQIAGQLKKAPWMIALVFLIVGSIFLTPVILLVGIIWYKLRKARLQNEAMLRLAERGVVPPAQAADALAAGASPARVAPQLYQQAVAMRRQIVWSDLRKGIILSMIGLAFLLYWIVNSGEPSWVGLILLFVGAGYIVLWWLEGRHLPQPGAGKGTETTPS